MAHDNTVFSHIFKLVARHEFESLARKHPQGRQLRKMTRRAPFVSPGLAQSAGRMSLPDVVSNHKAQALSSGLRGTEPSLLSQDYQFLENSGPSLNTPPAPTASPASLPRQRRYRHGSSLPYTSKEESPLSWPPRVRTSPLWLPAEIAARDSRRSASWQHRPVRLNATSPRHAAIRSAVQESVGTRQQACR